MIPGAGGGSVGAFRKEQRAPGGSGSVCQGHGSETERKQYSAGSCREKEAQRERGRRPREGWRARGGERKKESGSENLKPAILLKFAGR